VNLQQHNNRRQEPPRTTLYRADRDLNSLHLRELEETTRTPSYYVDEDYTAGPEIQ